MSARTALVVGASSGIGLATARQLAAQDWRLVLAARDQQALDAAAHACKEAGAEDVVTVAADVGDRADVDRMVAAAAGSLDLVVHTATVMAYGTVEQLPADVFAAVSDTAVHGTLHLAQAVLPRMRRQGQGVFVIVNSLLGSVTVPNMGAYTTAKWGQLALARTLQQETRDARGVHVCIVSPGSTNTPIYFQAANFTGRPARPPVPVVQPERTARAIVQLADRPRRHVSVPVGPPNPIVITGYRLFPRLYDLLVGPLFKLAAVARGTQAPTRGNVDDPVPELERVHGHWPDR